MRGAAAVERAPSGCQALLAAAACTQPQPRPPANAPHCLPCLPRLPQQQQPQRPHDAEVAWLVEDDAAAFGARDTHWKAFASACITLTLGVLGR